MKVIQEYFGETGKAKGIFLYTIANDAGITVKLTNYGATITSILTPDRNVIFSDIVLGFDNIDQYIEGHPFFGVVCGRYANRIARGEFTLEGSKYTLARNDGNNTLHGGIKGFDKVIWQAETFEYCDEAGVKFNYTSPDNEEGFPGKLSVEVNCFLTNKNELFIKYSATTDKTTVINLTNHSYFNLSGCQTPVNDHVLTINSTEVTAINDEHIPTGEIDNIVGTSFDFSAGKSIGKDIDKIPGGYDHNYIIEGKPGEIRPAGKLCEPITGRTLEVTTSQPAMQLYTANYLDGSIIGKNGIKYTKHMGLCLETQHYPDSPNQPNFPSTILKPDGTFYEITIFKFGIEK